MSSWFYLEFDTTGPTLNIVAPDYNKPDMPTPISIISNEDLSDYQDIYIIDADGVRHDVTFVYENGQLYTVMDFGEYPLGLMTMYARVKDTVDNISPTAVKILYLRWPILGSVTIAANGRELTLEEFTRILSFMIEARESELSVGQRAAVESLTRRIVLEVEEL